MNCDHKWILYQPLVGPAFECCSRCPMTKAEYDKQGGGTFKPAKFISAFANLIKPGTLAYDNSFHAILNSPIGGPSTWVPYTPIASIQFTLPMIYHSSVPEPQLISSGKMALAAGDWLPDVDPRPGDNFCGVDRSYDTVRLAGIRYNAANQTIVEALTNAVALCASEGGVPDIVFLSPLNVATYCAELGSRLQLASVSFAQSNDQVRAAVLHSPYGRIHIVEDVTLTDDKAYMLTLDTWFYCPKQKHVWTTIPGHNCVISF